MGSTNPAPKTPVTYEVVDDVAWLTINRPEARNALNKSAREGLWRGFQDFIADHTAKVMVFTATGDKAFCADADLKEMAETGLEVPPPDFLPSLNRNIKTDKPVIAAVNGIAFAGGFFLAQMCDLCIAADHALFAITEARWSRGAPWAAPLPWLIPPRVALEILLTAEPLDAHRAHEIGLVNKVVPLAELRETAGAMAKHIASLAPLSVQAAKKMVYRSAEPGWSEALAEADQIWEHVYQSEDAQEGPRAFREKRPPQWKGR